MARLFQRMTAFYPPQQRSLDLVIPATIDDLLLALDSITSRGWRIIAVEKRHVNDSWMIFTVQYLFRGPTLIRVQLNGSMRYDAATQTTTVSGVMSPLRNLMLLTLAIYGAACLFLFFYDYDNTIIPQIWPLMVAGLVLSLFTTYVFYRRDTRELLIIVEQALQRRMFYRSRR